MAELDNTLQGMSLTAPAAQQPLTPDTDPEVRRVQDAFSRIAEMIEKGQLSVNQQVRSMFDEEAANLNAEPVMAPPGPVQAGAATFGGILSSSLTGQPGIASGIQSVIEQRRRESVGQGTARLESLRDLRANQLRAESATLQNQNDIAGALKREEELAKLRTKQEKEAGARAEENAEKTRAHELEKERIRAAGRENLVRLRHELKTSELEQKYEVPKHVAQMMQDRRKAIQTSTDKLIQGLGGLAMITEEQLVRLQGKERADMDASDQELLEQYRLGQLTRPPGSGAPADSGATKDPRQTELDRIRANARK